MGTSEDAIPPVMTQLDVDGEVDQRFQLADDLHATQAVERQMKQTRNQKNTPAENGIIEEIRCTNFMCHEQLTVTLGPLINFIIGHNGSGKSAVLTALTLCLGGKATSTNRGQNLQSFIKEGRDSCMLSVKIKNQGTSGFKQDLYGKSIIVERHFSRAGSSSFKLKDANGKLVSTRKSDLEDIIDAFALQIENPMNVLTQDMARQFLSDSTGKDKFKFFMKGTQLETLSTDYMMLGNNIDVMEQKLRTKEEDIKAYKKAFDEARKKASRAQSIQAMREKETETKYQMAWSVVEAEEKKLQNIEADLDGTNAEIEERQNTAEAASDKFKSANAALVEAEARVRDCQTELDPLNERHRELREQFDTNKTALIKTKVDERNIGSKIIAKAKAIQKLKDNIKECRLRQAAADGGRHAELFAEHAQATADVEAVKQELDHHEQGGPELKRRLRELDGEIHQREQAVRSKQQEVQDCQLKIRGIQAGHRKWIDAYDRSLPDLMLAIDQETRFRQQPIGPMGRYVQILKPEWTPILEKQAGGALNAFVVTSKADQSLLSDLMRRYRWQSPIYIGEDKQIDTTNHEPDPTLDTWMRVLKFTNNLVRNQMIINQRIDQVVLIAKREEAVEFMMRPANGRRNCGLCFTMSDDNNRKGHCISVREGSGAFNMDPIGEWRKDYRMQADTESRLAAEKATLDRLQQEWRNLRSAKEESEGRRDSCREEIGQHQLTTRQLSDRLQRAQEKVEQLAEELDETAPVVGEIERLEEDLQTEEDQKAFEEGQLADVVAEKDRLNVDNRKLKDQLDELKEQISQLEGALGKVHAKTNKLRNKRDEALREKNQALELVSEAEALRIGLDQQREEQVQELAGVEEQARTVCPDRQMVPEGETFDSLERKLRRLVQDREECERELGGSQEELLAKAKEAKLAYMQAKSQALNLSKMAQHFKLSLSDRSLRWQKFRRHIASRARITFGYLLSERNFRGQLSIDHASKHLEIHVEPDITRTNDEGRQAKTLSGGEKSFSTICLLLALWDAMGSPIRCLDEFDVFMDNVNRDISMRMMIQAARRAVGRQYILITPQAMGNVPLEEDVKIIKMRDPERGQTTLPFGS
jgi:chromosome segregation ATPase